ncbi:hypothetical protein IE53DRAFT_387229 [Violaceomyces palustris]|uniref:Uncharacterized protein n=1 Tax=Violaceomyces palustris TaxID=1673888 RepID=A0ACD0NXF6_9BASI|nr:hypothetical protein IE53DRAFT_387229 [Violaceomyces palustris]
MSELFDSLNFTPSSSSQPSTSQTRVYWHTSPSPNLAANQRVPNPNSKQPELESPTLPLCTQAFLGGLEKISSRISSQSGASPVSKRRDLNRSKPSSSPSSLLHRPTTRDGDKVAAACPFQDDKRDEEGEGEDQEPTSSDSRRLLHAGFTGRPKISPSDLVSSSSSRSGEGKGKGCESPEKLSSLESAEEGRETSAPASNVRTSSGSAQARRSARRPRVTRGAAGVPICKSLLEDLTAVLQRSHQTPGRPASKEREGGVRRHHLEPPDSHAKQQGDTIIPINSACPKQLGRKKSLTRATSLDGLDEPTSPKRTSSKLVALGKRAFTPTRSAGFIYQDDDSDEFPMDDLLEAFHSLPAKVTGHVEGSPPKTKRRALAPSLMTNVGIPIPEPKRGQEEPKLGQLPLCAEPQSGNAKPIQAVALDASIRPVTTITRAGKSASESPTKRSSSRLESRRTTEGSSGLQTMAKSKSLGNMVVVDLTRSERATLPPPAQVDEVDLKGRGKDPMAEKSTRCDPSTLVTPTIAASTGAPQQVRPHAYKISALGKRIPRPLLSQARQPGLPRLSQAVNHCPSSSSPSVSSSQAIKGTDASLEKENLDQGEATTTPAAKSVVGTRRIQSDCVRGSGSNGGHGSRMGRIGVAVNRSSSSTPFRPPVRSSVAHHPPSSVDRKMAWNESERLGKGHRRSAASDEKVHYPEVIELDKSEDEKEDGGEGKPLAARGTASKQPPTMAAAKKEKVCGNSWADGATAPASNGPEPNGTTTTNANRRKSLILPEKRKEQPISEPSSSPRSRRKGRGVLGVESGPPESDKKRKRTSHHEIGSDDSFELDHDIDYQAIEEAAFSLG